MSIKRILVPLPSSADHAAEIAIAVSTAKALNAHLVALYIDQPIALPEGVRTAAAYQYAFTEEGGARRLPAGELIARQHEERDRQAEAARDRFVEACAASEIRFIEAAESPSAPPTASWRRAEGSYERTAGERAVAFDLVIATSAVVATALKDIAETSLLESRRPVLLAPVDGQTTLGDTAMIAWDASPQCWHAVSAAQPFLERARTVEVISVGHDEERRKASQAELLAYLACHGITAVSELIAPHSRSIGQTLLTTAEERRAGLVVMGAYSHSRWREMLVGGVTRHVLMNATATPVLMAH